MGSIVVGVDESAGAAEALRWAARESQLRGWPVTAVLCWGYLDQHHATPGQAFDPDYSHDDARAALDMVVTRVIGEGEASIGRVTVNDVAVRGLLDASVGADLLVVGARGLGALRRLLLGSVSQGCVHHATIPIAIVRATRQPAPLGAQERIVVGVDGSVTAQHALDWALDEARLRRAAVDVVYAWHPPAAAVPTLADSYGPFDEAARAVLDTAVEKADTKSLPVPIRRRLKTGSGGHALVDTAKGADLVVVGSRGLGGFCGLLLGSVSSQVSHHAPCPVVVIPHTVDGS